MSINATNIFYLHFTQGVVFIGSMQIKTLNASHVFAKFKYKASSS